MTTNSFPKLSRYPTVRRVRSMVTAIASKWVFMTAALATTGCLVKFDDWPSSNSVGGTMSNTGGASNVAAGGNAGTETVGGAGNVGGASGTIGTAATGGTGNVGGGRTSPAGGATAVGTNSMGGTATTGTVGTGGIAASGTGVGGTTGNAICKLDQSQLGGCLLQ